MQASRKSCLTLLVALITITNPQAVMAQESMSPDAKTLKALAKAGSDLTKPHVFNHWLHFPDETNARAAAKDLASAGFAIDSVEKLTGAADWRVLTLKTIIPSLPDVERTSAFLEDLALRHHGEYDGWETQVEK